MTPNMLQGQKSFDFETSPFADLNTSNHLDLTPSNMVDSISVAKWDNIIDMLTALGLEKYIRPFQEQEIDLATFSSLTSKDLMELGVLAFGARRKMLLAISGLKKNLKPVSRAPGAERKSSSSTISDATGSPRENW